MPVYMRDQLDPRLSPSHFVAYTLRMLREYHGLSLSECGKILGLERATISNFESGRRKFCDEYAKLLDQHYGLGELLQTIVFYARMGHDANWAKTVTELEVRARVLKIYHGHVVPIPFQTEDTMRAQLSAGRAVIDVEAVVQSRMARQEAILERADPPYIWALLDEAVLEQRTGGVKALRAQLAHLRELSLRPNIGVRVIPKTVGSHVGTDGPIRFLSLEDRDVAYAGAWRGGRMIESLAEVWEAALDWDYISQKALSDEDTRSLIGRKMEDLE